MSLHSEHYSLELKIAKFLRYGVIFALILLSIGWIGQISQGHNLSAFKEYTSVSFMVRWQMAISNSEYFLLISYLGLFALILLPVLRVLFTAILFLKQKEKPLAFLAFFVLVTLIISFSLGIDL